MTGVFADTFYWIALVSRTNAAHDRARQFARESASRIVTTEWVLTEVANAKARKHGRHLVARLRELWRSDENLTIIQADHKLFELGLDLFCNRIDKDWSLTDCISFLVMQTNGLTEALTADRHYEQAGFIPILR